MLNLLAIGPTAIPSVSDQSKLTGCAENIGMPRMSTVPDVVAMTEHFELKVLVMMWKESHSPLHGSHQNNPQPTL